MPEGSEGQKPLRKEQGSIPEYKQEIVQYQNNQLAMRLLGEPGAKFDFNLHKHSPTYNMLRKGEAIVSTKSENDYYMISDGKGVYIINTGESTKSGKLVYTFREFPVELPVVEFDKPWEIPDFYTTSSVESILIRGKVGNAGNKIDEENPFDKYKKQYEISIH